MDVATDVFVELIVLATRDARSGDLPIRVAKAAGDKYFQHHAASEGWVDEEHRALGSTSQLDSNISGSFAAHSYPPGKRLRSEHQEFVELLDRVPTRSSPAAWQLVDPDGAERIFSTALEPPIPLRIERRGGFAWVLAPGQSVTDATTESVTSYEGWISYQDLVDGELNPVDGEFDDVAAAEWLATSEALDKGTVDHRQLLADLLRAVAHLNPKVGSPGRHLVPDAHWISALGHVVAEVKTCGPRSVASQIRVGLGQVIQYKWIEQQRHDLPVVAALVISVEPPDPWPQICASVGVRLLWPPFDLGALGRPRPSSAQ